MDCLVPARSVHSQELAIPNIPNTNTAGQVLTSKGDGQNGSYWAGGNSGKIRFSQTYSVSGALAVPRGASNFLPPVLHASHRWANSEPRLSYPEGQGWDFGYVGRYPKWFGGYGFNRTDHRRLSL